MKSKLMILVGVLMLGVGMFFTLQPIYRNKQVEHRVDKVIKNYDPVKSKDVLTKREREFLEENKSEGNQALPTEIDTDSRGFVVGKVSIPSIDSVNVIYKGEFSALGDNMEYGAVTNKLNQEMGKRNYVLSSHIVNNKKQLFSSLDKVKVGDKVYLADTEYLYTYEITKGTVVTPKDTWILNDIDGKATITLYTCIYLDEYESDGTQKTDRTVRFGNYLGKEKLTDDLKSEYF